MGHDHGAVLQFDGQKILTIGALAGQKAVIQPSLIDSSRLQGFHLIWVKLTGFYDGKTVTEGPVMIGLSCNLTADELEAILEDDIQSRSDPTATGPGSWYYPIIVVDIDADEGDIWSGSGNENALRSSLFKKVMVRWTIPEGKAFGFFAYNLEAGTLTTGMTVTFDTQYFGAWLRD